MSDQSVHFTINIQGNAQNSLQAISQNVTALTNNVSKSIGIFNVFSTKIFALNQFTQVVENTSAVFSEFAQSGLSFQQSIADLSSITGIAGSDLESLTEKSREFGKKSGLGAVGIAESYKILASQIDVTKIGMEGLNTLQETTILLAHASGLDMQTSATAIAGTINQFGLQANEANRVVNVLAAGAKYGAAEIGDLSQSFKVVGATANAAGLGVEQTAGAIEVLSKNNLKGAEAGVALRNIFLKMQTELKVNFAKTSFSEALDNLKPKLKDATYLAKLFGLENISAAQFLIANSAAVKEMTTRVTDTNVASEQAAIRTATYSEELKRNKAVLEDYKIAMFNATGSFLPWVSSIGEAMTPIARLMPLITGMGSGIVWAFSNFMPGVELLKVGFSSITGFVGRMGTVFSLQMAFMRADLASTSLASIGFRGNMIRAMLATINFGTKGLFAAIKGLGALVLSFITTGTASATFAGIASVSFASFKMAAIGACQSISIAIKSIPIIGWVIALVAAVAAAVTYFAFTKKGNTENAAAVAEAARIGREYYAQEKASLDVLFEKLKRTNPKSKERNELVNELKGIYPDLNKQVLDDITNTNNLSGAYDLLIERIKVTAKTKYQTSLLDATYAEQGKLEGTIKERLVHAYRYYKENNQTPKEMGGIESKAGLGKMTEDEYVNSEMARVKLLGKLYKNGVADLTNSVKDAYYDTGVEEKKGVKAIADLTTGYITPTKTDPTNPITPVNPIEAAADAISGGGKSIKQITINLESLIHTNTNVFDQGQNPADAQDFMSKLTTALQMIVNDVNYAN